MAQRKDLEEEARRQYLKQKEQADRQVRKLIEEQRNRIQAEEQRKKQYYNTMLEQYEAKNKIRLQMEEQNTIELEKIKQYQARLDQKDRQQRAEIQRKQKEK